MQRPCSRFRSVRVFICEIFKEMIYPNLKSFIWRKHVGAGNQQRNQRVFLRKRVFISRGTNKHFKKVVLFLILGNLHDSSLGRRVSKASHNSLEIQTHSITQTIAKRRTLLK